MKSLTKSDFRLQFHVVGFSGTVYFHIEKRRIKKYFWLRRDVEVWEQISNNSVTSDAAEKIVTTLINFSQENPHAIV